MSKTESAIIAVFLSIACPLTFFVFAWWTSATLYYEGAIPEKAVPSCAFAGLGLGIIIVILRLKRWVPKFYAMKKILAVPLYLSWSAIAIAFFMGLPIGVVALGLLAGLYIGRRERHARREVNLFEKDARRVSLFTAGITGFVSLAMVMLAMQTDDLLRILTTAGFGWFVTTPARKIVFVAIAVAVLTTLQYWLTRRTASWGFRLGTDEA